MASAAHLRRVAFNPEIPFATRVRYCALLSALRRCRKPIVMNAPLVEST